MKLGGERAGEGERERILLEVPVCHYLTQDCTVYVECPDVSEEALRLAFSQFGEIQTLLSKNNRG